MLGGRSTALPLRRGAVQARATFLVEHKLAEQRGGRAILVRDLLATLRAREIAAAARLLANETGLVHRAVKDGAPVSGVYRRSAVLASGRFAMLELAIRTAT
jgi:hypothetical protein